MDCLFLHSYLLNHRGKPPSTHCPTPYHLLRETKRARLREKQMRHIEQNETMSSCLVDAFPVLCTRLHLVPYGPVPIASQPVPSASQHLPSSSQPVPEPSQPVPSPSQPVQSPSQHVPPVTTRSKLAPSRSKPVTTRSAPVTVPSNRRVM